MELYERSLSPEVNRVWEQACDAVERMTKDQVFAELKDRGHEGEVTETEARQTLAELFYHVWEDDVRDMCAERDYDEEC